MTAGQHPERDLIAYVRGELAADARRRVAAHLADCRACRATVEELSAVVAAVAAAPAPPAPAWGRYRADLAARVAARRGRRRWTVRLAPLAVAGALAAVLLTLTLSGPAKVDLQSDAIAVLDLMDNLEVIDNLDRLPATPEG